MITEAFDYLPEDAKYIREEVFMREQGFENEFDEIDDIAVHIVAYDNGVPVAVCRVFAENGEYFLGRVAVLKEYRGKNIGKLLLSEADKKVRELGGKSISAHSQCRAKGFYAASGYTEVGEIDYDEGCPHIMMKKTL